MTPQEFREAALENLSPYLGSAVPRSWSTMIDRYLWLGICDMSRRCRPLHLRATQDQNVVASQANYYLPLAVHHVLAVRLKDASGEWSTALMAVVEDLDKMDTDSAFWYPNGVETTAGADYGKRIITLSPTPAASITNGLRVRYIRTPTKIGALTETSEVIDVPEQYHDGLLDYICWRWARNQSSRLKLDPNAYWQSYLEVVQRYVDDESERRQYQYRPLVQVAWETEGPAFWDSY